MLVRGVQNSENTGANCFNVIIMCVSRRGCAAARNGSSPRSFSLTRAPRTASHFGNAAACASDALLDA